MLIISIINYNIGFMLIYLFRLIYINYHLLFVQGMVKIQSQCKVICSNFNIVSYIYNVELFILNFIVDIMELMNNVQKLCTRVGMLEAMCSVSIYSIKR